MFESIRMSKKATFESTNLNASLFLEYVQHWRKYGSRDSKPSSCCFVCEIDAEEIEITQVLFSHRHLVLLSYHFLQGRGCCFEEVLLYKLSLLRETRDIDTGNVSVCWRVE